MTKVLLLVAVVLWAPAFSSVAAAIGLSGVAVLLLAVARGVVNARNQEE